MEAKGELISFKLNGEQVSAHVAPHQPLIDVLRNFGLYGARESCGQGVCGCCTVAVDGLPVSSCLSLGALAHGADIRTVESLAVGGKLSPVQEAFLECGAFQCGFCTPGFVMMTTHLLQLEADPSDDQIRDYLTGNLCRCASYPEILHAVKVAALKQRGSAVATPPRCGSCSRAPVPSI